MVANPEECLQKIMYCRSVSNKEVFIILLRGQLDRKVTKCFFYRVAQFAFVACKCVFHLNNLLHLLKKFCTIQEKLRLTGHRQGLLLSAL